MRRIARRLLRVLAAGLALSVASCGRSDHEAVYPASGKVFYRGRPAEGALVTLVPLDASNPKARRPGAEVRNDGTFRLSTYASYDGAPAGRYAVTIVYRSPQRKVDDENRGPDLLRGRYADPKLTPLTVDIKPGVTEIPPFDLN